MVENDFLAASEPDSSLWWIYLLAIALATASAFFSGLTLGLMTQDITTLKALVDTGNRLQQEYEELREKWNKVPVIADRLEGDDTSSSTSLSDIEHLGEHILNAAHENLISKGSVIQNDCDRLEELTVRCTHAKYAKRILKLRRDGNLLLVTLLVGNVAVNSAFSIVLGEAMSSLAGFLVSTIVITLFGEILPQAACSRFGLVIGYYAVPFLMPIMWILWPICKPISWCLDAVLGKDGGQQMSRDELRGYINVIDKNDVKDRSSGSFDLADKGSLNNDEASWIAAVLHSTRRSAREVMTPLDKAITLGIDEKLTNAVVERMLASGFSRFPVVDDGVVKGTFFLKDFLAVPHNENLTVGMVMAYFNKRTMVFPANVKLYVLFKYMSQQQCHMVILNETISDHQSKIFGLTPDEQVLDRLDDSILTGRHIGIITLEDVIEKLLKIDILDEYDLQGDLLHQSSSILENRTLASSTQCIPYSPCPLPVNLPGSMRRHHTQGITPALASLRLFSERSHTATNTDEKGEQLQSDLKKDHVIIDTVHDVLDFDSSTWRKSDHKNSDYSPSEIGYAVQRLTSTSEPEQLSLEMAQWNYAFLLEPEIDAAVSFLRSRDMPAFRPDVIGDASLRGLLRKSLIVSSNADAPRYFFKQRQTTNPFLIVLTGRLTVISHTDRDHRVKLGPWETVEGSDLMNDACKGKTVEYEALLEASPWTSTSRVLVVPSELYTHYAGR